MDMPSPKLVFIIVLFNIIMFTLSFSLQSYFGGAAFIETGASDTLAIPEFPDISFDSIGAATTGIWAVVLYIADSLGLLLSILTFDIVGLPIMVRFLIVTPFTLANFYIGFVILIRIVEVIGEWVPF